MTVLRRLRRWLGSRQRPEQVVRCAGIPATLIPRGFVLDWVGYDVVWVASCDTTIDATGHVCVPVVLEEKT